MSVRRTTTVGLAASVLVATALVPAVAGAGWTPAQELWAVPQGSQVDTAVALSADGTQGLVVARNKASTWTPQGWTVGKKIPGAADSWYMDHPDAQLSANGKRALVTWEGESNEGIVDLWGATRKGGAWKAQRFGAGRGAAALATFGAGAVMAWYDDSPDFGTVDHLYVSRWNGTTWSAKADISLPVGLLADTGHPAVAVSDSGDGAVVAWNQGNRMRVSFWNGWTWSAPLDAGPGSEQPLAADYADGVQATLLAARQVAGGQRLQQYGATAVGGFDPLVAVLGVVPGRLDGLSAHLAADGLGGLVTYTDIDSVPFASGVATWTGIAPLTVTPLGPVSVAGDIARDATSGVVATMTDSSVPGAGKAVRVRRWNGTTWGAAKTVGQCRDNSVSAAASWSGQVLAAGWACGHVHVARNPQAPTMVKKLAVSVKGRKATVTWKRARNAGSYEFRAKGKRMTPGWQSTTATTVKLRIKPGSRYRVSVRGMNAGGPGPVATLRF